MKALQYLNKYFRKYKWRLLAGIIITILSKFLALRIPVIIRNSLNSVENYIKGYSVDIEVVKYDLLRNIFFIIGLTLVAGFFTFLMRQTIIVMSRLIEFDLKNEIYAQYQKLSLNFYKNNRTGDLMNRISEDVSKVRMYFGPAIMYSLNMILSFIVGFTQMYSISPKLALYTMIPFPVLSVSIFILSKQINKRSTIVQQYLSKLTTYNQEFFSGIHIVKSFSIENDITEKFDALADDSKSKNIDLYKVQALFFPLMILLIGISNIIVLYIGGKLYINEQIQIGVVAEFFLYVNILTWPVAIVGWVTSIVQQAEASQQRINEFLEQVPEIKNNVEESTNIEGDIEFRNVSLVYEDTNIKALNNLSFKVKKGETVAILGSTGCGKSSLVNLIARLYDVSDGSVLVDGEDIRKCNLFDVRSQIGFVAQDPFLFSDTIENNIKFGKEDASKEEIIEAAKNAVIHDNIMSFKNNYSTVLGERGVTLSGGQKQRTSIARAIIKKPKILIFDDCLSAVDTETEEKILLNLEKVSKNKTTFIISHRISSVKNADKILVLNNGTVQQEGVHNQLVMEDGYYKDLFHQQLLEKEI
ncbi:ABC transporter ATP-binding protein [Tenacibaculum sp. C7A-26P2]|uniref:ABC transporter ATP-binding protein n=1 Tax=Tenacibaculum sp. C7A-26P2 TaxID=3447504 RepID=UPI003F84B533